MSSDNVRVRELEDSVGHPGDKQRALVERVQSDAVQWFADIQREWLDLMWTLDAYRRRGVAPAGMGNQALPAGERLAGIYRGKGNWFAEVLALLLENQTDQRVASRHRVRGFSQYHQVDVAWPVREADVLICAEAKVSGGPPYGSHEARSATSDWSNRRKELKFAATDLKLYRRGRSTRIEHWDVWRNDQPPKIYTLWAARMGPKDAIEKMVGEVQSLVNTYLDGAGVWAWAEADDGESYEMVPLPIVERVSDLDDVLDRIATEIRRMAGPENEPLPAIRPS